MKKCLLSFLLIVVLLFNSPMILHASSVDNETVGNLLDDMLQSKTGMDNMFRLFLEQLGVILNPSLWGTGSLSDRFRDYAIEQSLIDSTDSYDDYIKSHVTAEKEENSNNINYSADSEIVNNIYNFACDYMKENAGFTPYRTADYRRMLTYYSDKFSNKKQIDSLRNYIAGSNSSKIFVLTNNNYNVTLEDGTTENCYQFLEVDMVDKNFVFSDLKSGRYKTLLYSSDTWLDVSEEGKYMYIKQDGTIFNDTKSKFTNLTFACRGVAYDSGYYYYYYPYETVNYFKGDVVDGYTIKGLQVINSYALVSRDIVTYRIYDTLDDMKNYSVGNRPYYTTSAFGNYNSSVDNSMTFTQTDIDNSTDYNTIYNYIINNYDNADGLTESELIAILDKYFSEHNNDDDSGGGDSDSGDSGGGLGGFLSGLGSIGDAILSILGKLMEYVGKAIELLSGTITKVIDIIPTNITALFSAMFPFFPEEWLVAIELLLVLTAVGAIWGIFKK